MIDILLPGIQPVRAKLKSNAKNGRCNSISRQAKMELNDTIYFTDKPFGY